MKLAGPRDTHIIVRQSIDRAGDGVKHGEVSEYSEYLRLWGFTIPVDLINAVDFVYFWGCGKCRMGVVLTGVADT